MKMKIWGINTTVVNFGIYKNEPVYIYGETVLRAIPSNKGRVSSVGVAVKYRWDIYINFFIQHPDRGDHFLGSFYQTKNDNMKLVDKVYCRWIDEKYKQPATQIKKALVKYFNEHFDGEFILKANEDFS